MSALSDWIKERRRELGFTQAQVASKLGLHQANVSSLENGKFLPDAEMMKKIDAVFGQFAGSYVPVQSAPGTKKVMPAKTQEGLKAFREAKENNFFLRIDDNTYITADRNQYILKQSAHTAYFVEIRALLKFLVVTHVRQSAVNSVKEIIAKQDEIFKLIEEKFANYDPANISEETPLYIEDDE